MVIARANGYRLYASGERDLYGRFGCGICNAKNFGIVATPRPNLTGAALCNHKVISNTYGSGSRGGQGSGGDGKQGCES